MLKPKLRDWYDDSADFEGASYEDCFREAQTAYRVQTGNFLEVAVTKPLSDLHPRDERAECPNHERICLVDDFLIDVPYPFRHLRVTNLVTGQHWRAGTDARETISKVTASDQLIAFWTLGRQDCYVFNFAGVREAKFRLPSSMSRIATCRERTIVCGGMSDGGVDLYFWNLDSKNGRSLRLDPSTFGSDMLGYVTSK